MRWNISTKFKFFTVLKKNAQVKKKDMSSQWYVSGTVATGHVGIDIIWQTLAVSQFRVCILRRTHLKAS